MEGLEKEHECHPLHIMSCAPWLSCVSEFNGVWVTSLETWGVLQHSLVSLNERCCRGIKWWCSSSSSCVSDWMGVVWGLCPRCVSNLKASLALCFIASDTVWRARNPRAVFIVSQSRIRSGPHLNPSWVKRLLLRPFLLAVSHPVCEVAHMMHADTWASLPRERVYGV